MIIKYSLHHQEMAQEDIIRVELPSKLIYDSLSVLTSLKTQTQFC